MEYLQLIINNALYLSLLLIIVSSIISVFFVGRKRDRCMRDLHRFLSYVYLKSGKIVYGVLHVFGTGIELLYKEAHRDRQGHLESSFILYSTEYGDIHAIKRFHRELTPENRKRRIKNIRAVYHPSIFRRTKRKIRNFLSTFQDGITRSINTVVTTAATRNPKSRISQQQKDLSGLGAQVVNVACHTYDPILERYIGHFVVLELPEKGIITEYCGILKEYTQNFIELLNILEIDEIRYEIAAGEPVDNGWLHIEWKRNQICIDNNSDWPVFLHSVTCSGSSYVYDQLIEEKTCFSLDSATPLFPSADTVGTVLLVLLVPNIFDMVVPRPFGAIRHGCPRMDHNLDTFIGASTSMTLREAFHMQFVMQVNAVKNGNPAGTGLRD